MGAWGPVVHDSGLAVDGADILDVGLAAVRIKARPECFTNDREHFFREQCARVQQEKQP